MGKTVIYYFLMSVLPFSALAGSIEGIALEHLTSLPLARARVTLERLEDDRLRPVGTVSASRTGQFSFGPLAEGYYQVSASRAGFATSRFGQHWNGGPGLPIYVTRDRVQFAELRLKRLGLITGRTLDENRVGLPGVPVHAYTTSAPMRMAASAVSDDLGVYRLSGLAAGKYFIRTGPAQADEALRLVPTYYPFASMQLADARPIAVELDSETVEMNIQPVPGTLSAVTVAVSGCLGVARVTLASDVGRRQLTAVCNNDAVVFAGLGPGEYEVLAEGEADRQKLAAFVPLLVEGARREVGLHLRPLPELRVRVNEAAGPALGEAVVVVRRRDPAGEGPEVAVSAERMPLAPGNWQITARPATGSLADIKFQAGAVSRLRRDPDPDWFEFNLTNSTQVNVSVSAQAAQLSGHVSLGGKDAIAAPVYLLATQAQTRRRVNGPRVTQTDRSGNYRFQGLAAGTYLVMSSLDLAEVSEEGMGGRAQTITVEEGRGSTRDLELTQLR